MSIIISILTFIGSTIFIDIANNILIESFEAITGALVVNIDIITFDLTIVLLSIGASVVLGLISTAFPLLMLRNIKPINIIKAKE